MNAVLPLRRWQSPWPVLRNCVPAWVRVAVFFGSGVLFPLGAWVMAGDQPRLAILPCVLAVALAWMLWFSNLLNLDLEARQSRMPALSRMVGVAVACAWLATVLLPAAALAWVGWEFVTTLSILTCIAAGGLLLFLLPRALLIACCLLPMAGNQLGRIIDLSALSQWSWQAAYWPWLAVGMALLVAWCWRSALRWAENANGFSWWQPLGLAKLQAAKTTHGKLLGYPEPWRAWAWLHGGRVDAGPADPARAMRSLIGGAYAPWNLRRLLVEMLAVIVAGAFVVRLENPILHGALLVGIAIGGGFASMAYGQRLEMLYSQDARELDELALLPGWGDAAQACATLLRTLAWPPLRLLLSLFVLGPVVLAAMDIAVPPASAALLLLLAVVTVLLAALACLRPVAGLSIAGLKGSAIVAPGLVLIALGAFRVSFEGARHSGLLIGALLLACIGYGLALHATWRRFRARPHPFLRE